MEIILTFLPSSLSDSAVGEPVNRSVSLAMVGWGGRLFLSGGFNGVTLGRLLTLTLPSDPCALLPTPEACNTTTGSCVWCRGTCAASDTAERYSYGYHGNDVVSKLLTVFYFGGVSWGCHLGKE